MANEGSQFIVFPCCACLCSFKTSKASPDPWKKSRIPTISSFKDVETHVFSFFWTKNGGHLALYPSFRLPFLLFSHSSTKAGHHQFFGKSSFLPKYPKHLSSFSWISAHLPQQKPSNAPISTCGMVTVPLLLPGMVIMAFGFPRPQSHGIPLLGGSSHGS